MLEVHWDYLNIPFLIKISLHLIHLYYCAPDFQLYSMGYNLVLLLWRCKNCPRLGMLQSLQPHFKEKWFPLFLESYTLLFILSFYLTYSPSHFPLIVGPLPHRVFKCWVCRRPLSLGLSFTRSQVATFRSVTLKEHLSAEICQIFRVESRPLPWTSDSYT